MTGIIYRGNTTDQQLISGVLERNDDVFPKKDMNEWEIIWRMEGSH